MDSFMAVQKFELDTPSLLIDIDKLTYNLDFMQTFMDNAGKKIRPHAKTHKCSEIARRQLEKGAVGVCAAKVSEAEVLVRKGIFKVLITSPVVGPLKIERLMKCLGLARENLIVAVDNYQNASDLNAAAAGRGIKLNILVDINPNMGRTGVALEDAFSFAKSVSKFPSLVLKGVQCYAGNLQHLVSYDIRQSASLEILGRAAEIFRTLRAEKLPVEIFTGSGTGTYDIDVAVPELTDLQVGSYCLMDTEYMQIGSKGHSDSFRTFRPALTVLSTVVSVNQPLSVTIDAGLKSIYHQEKAPPSVLFPAGTRWTYSWFGDEHGRLNLDSAASKPVLGSKVELTASHCDPTVNLHDYLYIVSGEKVIDRWEIDMRGCCY